MANAMACGIPSIPNLPEETLLHCINTVTSLGLTPNDLKNPTYDVVNTIFNAFACFLLDISLEQITQVPLHVLETIAHPELNIEEAVGPLMCIQTLVFLFNHCGIYDFCRDDLRMPTKKRTKKLLCALVNFYQYCVQNSEIKDNTLVRVETLSKEINEFTEKRQILKEKIAQLKYERMEKQKAVQEMNQSALKAKQMDIADVKAHGINQVEELKNIAEDFQNHLTVKKASRLIKQAEELVEEKIAREQNLMQKEKAYGEFGGITPSLLKTIEGIKEFSRKYTITSKKDEELSDLSLEIAKETKEIDNQIEFKKKIIEGKKESNKRITAKRDNKLLEQQDYQQKYNQKKEQHYKEITEIQKHLTDIRVELKSLTEKELTQKTTKNKNIKALNEKFQAVVQQATMYTSNINTQCDQINDELQHLKIRKRY